MQNGLRPLALGFPHVRKCVFAVSAAVDTCHWQSVMLHVSRCGLLSTTHLQLSKPLPGVQSVLLPLAQGRLLRDARGHTPSMYVEAAHEALLDTCLCPGLLHDAFASLDCRLECSNLFEDIWRVLARRAHARAPARGVLPVHQLALKGLVAAAEAMVCPEGLPESLVAPPACLFGCPAKRDLWHSIVAGEAPACEVRCRSL